MNQPKLTVGMACFDDFDGVYFTVQSLRLHHPEVMDQVEILVVDNHPDSGHGQAVEKLLRDVGSRGRYLPRPDLFGTSAPRDLVFREAQGEAVLCLDCHVMLPPGALKHLLDYYDRHPDSHDLLQGPLLDDRLDIMATHMDPVWRSDMLGIWGLVPGISPDSPPFEIPMHGCGLMSCRKEAWVGFNPGFRGFGGEEGYLHEKFRQAGHKTLCLPHLRWLHRFPRPGGVPYRLILEDRLYNYLLGRVELGLDYADVLDHLAPRLPRAHVDKVLQELNLPHLLSYWFGPTPAPRPFPTYESSPRPASAKQLALCPS